MLKNDSFSSYKLNKTNIRTVIPPKNLSLHENWDETVAFLGLLRENTNKAIAKYQASPKNISEPRNRNERRRAVINNGDYYDFSKIIDISPQVALVIASEYDRRREITGFSPSAIDFEKWNPIVRMLLTATGFLELSGVKKPVSDFFEMENMKILTMKSGKSINGELISNYLYELGYDVFVTNPSIYEAIIEAIGNTINHAYKLEEFAEKNSVKKWWIFGVRTRSDQTFRLRISVYDQGATIPRTIPTWKRYPNIKSIVLAAGAALGINSNYDAADDTSIDGDVIHAAIEVGKTSTDLPYRGHGMSQIVRSLELCKSGHVSIYSRAGCVRYAKDQSPLIKNLTGRITGTLVVWDIELEA